MSDMLGDIEKLEPYQPSIYLAKPDRTIICKLSEAYNIDIIQNLNGIHEVSLEIPYQVSRHNKNIRNEHVDLLRGHYLLKVDKDWFVVSNTQSSSGKESMQVEAKLLPYQLRRKTIFGLNEEKNATDILNSCLVDTPWSVAYVDADFALQTRRFEINDKTRLEFLFDIAEAYNGVLRFDTENLTISLYKLENVGTDKGLTISYGKYLKEIDKQPDFDDVCTRLYAYGKNGLDIAGITPTGTAYIEDFSYYLHPYSETITDAENDLYTVNSHSHYMSDELCHAILKYNSALENEEDNFTGYVNELASLNSQLTTLQEELEQCNKDLIEAEDKLAIHNARNNDVENQDLIGAVTTAESVYNAKLSEIEEKNAEIKTVNSSIESLRKRLELSDYFSTQLLQERDLFVSERKWTNDYYTEANELYERGITELKKASQPQIAYSLDIVDFLKVNECQHDWDKLAIGDIVTVKYKKFNVNIKAKIIKIMHNIDSNKLNIEIANTTDINRGFYEWIDLLKKSVSTSAVLNTNKYKWDEGYTANSKIESYMNNKIDAAKQTIVAGVNQSVNIDRQGIKISDPADSANFIRILHNVLAFTNDGGNTFKHAVTPNGIVGDYVYGKLIAGVNLTIESTDSQSFRVDENGVTIAGSALTITDGLPVDQLADGVIIEGNPYNGVVINSTEGIVITRSDSKVKTVLNATEGIKIQGSTNGTDWVDKLYADIDGNLHVEDLTANKIVIKDVNNNTLINAVNGLLDLRHFNTIAGKLTASNLEIKGTSVSDGSQTTFAIDNSGNVTIAGNITMTGGSITWGEGGVDAPHYGDISGTPDNADTEKYVTGKGMFLQDNQLHISASNITTGLLNASLITVGELDGSLIRANSITADKIDVSNLYVDRIYDSNNHGNYAKIGSLTGSSALDFTLIKEDGTEIFRVLEGLQSIKLFAYDSLILGHYAPDGTTYPAGTWDFNTCNVENLQSVAVFG